MFLGVHGLTNSLVDLPRRIAVHYDGFPQRKELPLKNGGVNKKTQAESEEAVKEQKVIDKLIQGKISDYLGLTEK